MLYPTYYVKTDKKILTNQAMLYLLYYGLIELIEIQRYKQI